MTFIRFNNTFFIQYIKRFTWKKKLSSATCSRKITLLITEVVLKHYSGKTVNALKR